MRLELLDGVRRQIQERLDLPPLYSGEVGEKLINRFAAFEVVNECVDRDSCTRKDQVTAVHFRIPGQDFAKVYRQ
ncbi:MAG TPA: hypothetical protein VMN60_05115 [Longimicrobiales bacterium]|nr:hypothetical protein [Longimicrobiales bacterium]